MSLLLKYHKDQPPLLTLAVLKLVGSPKVREQAVQNVEHPVLHFYPVSVAVAARVLCLFDRRWQAGIDNCLRLALALATATLNASKRNRTRTLTHTLRARS